MIRHIPEDVIWNILICLPAKQVAQMRCVSKAWNALLSQPSFIKSHLDHNLAHDDEILLVFISDKPSDLIGSDNGLICFSSFESVVHIWNPSLSALAALPDIVSTLDDDNDHMQFRFGYDPINDDYKVVKVMFRLGGSRLDEIQGDSHLALYDPDAAAVKLFSMNTQDTYPKVVELIMLNITFLGIILLASCTRHNTSLRRYSSVLDGHRDYEDIRGLAVFKGESLLEMGSELPVTCGPILLLYLSLSVGFYRHFYIRLFSIMPLPSIVPSKVLLIQISNSGNGFLFNFL
ncbi:F-box domain containing protein [Tanacetum coccineum]